MERIIGELGEKNSGPLLIFIGGLHGNEAMGVEALEHVFGAPEVVTRFSNGRAIALRGNLEALKLNVRFLDFDLNRMWDVKHFKRAHDYQVHELKELQALREVIEAEMEGHEGPIFLFDLHTTSAPTIPFIVTKSVPENQGLLSSFNLPYITGLHGHLDGTMLEWMCEKGYCGMAFEAGQHHSKTSWIKHEAFVKLAMHVSGVLKLGSDEEQEVRQRLADELAPAHAHFELIKRYKIGPDEAFKMEPGFSNFQRIFKGEVLATNQKGDIVSELDGNIFMPLYQKQGSDGFFIIQPCAKESF